jgi:hypothetical protein
VVWFCARLRTPAAANSSTHSCCVRAARRWVQAECRGLGEHDAPEVDPTLTAAVAALRDRPVLFKYCAEEVRGRRAACVQVAALCSLLSNHPLCQHTRTRPSVKYTRDVHDRWRRRATGRCFSASSLPSRAAARAACLARLRFTRTTRAATWLTCSPGCTRCVAVCYVLCVGDWLGGALLAERYTGFVTPLVLTVRTVSHTATLAQALCGEREFVASLFGDGSSSTAEGVGQQQQRPQGACVCVLVAGRGWCLQSSGLLSRKTVASHMFTRAFAR